MFRRDDNVNGIICQSYDDLIQGINMRRRSFTSWWDGPQVLYIYATVGSQDIASSMQHLCDKQEHAKSICTVWVVTVVVGLFILISLGNNSIVCFL